MANMNVKPLSNAKAILNVGGSTWVRASRLRELEESSPAYIVSIPLEENDEMFSGSTAVNELERTLV
jgi:hypothetical protein